MGLVDFTYSGSPVTWTVPGGVTEVELWIVGGGSTIDYWRDYPNDWTYSPYILAYEAFGWYLPAVPVTPGDVLGITIGQCSQLAQGGYPDGGSTVDLPRFDTQAPGHGGGGATRVTKNGEPWIIAGGAGGSVAMRVGERLGPMVVAPAGPTAIIPDLTPMDEYGGTTTINAVGQASSNGSGADGVLALPGYCVDLVWHPGMAPPGVGGSRLGQTSVGAGGGGYNGGASGGIRYWLDNAPPEGWPEEIMGASVGKAGGSLMPMEGAQMWAPAATVVYCDPSAEGYDPEYDGCPEPGYIPGHSYRSTGEYGSDGYLGLASPQLDRSEGWSLGRLRTS